MLDEIKKILEEEARKMADDEIRNYRVNVMINGRLVDLDSCITSDGEISVGINTPLFIGGDLYDLVPRVKRGEA